MNKLTKIILGIVILLGFIFAIYIFLTNYTRGPFYSCGENNQVCSNMEEVSRSYTKGDITFQECTDKIDSICDIDTINIGCGSEKNRSCDQRTIIDWIFGP
jgi:uncharacterized membrane protein